MLGNNHSLRPAPQLLRHRFQQPRGLFAADIAALKVNPKHQQFVAHELARASRRFVRFGHSNHQHLIFWNVIRLGLFALGDPKGHRESDCTVDANRPA